MNNWHWYVHVLRLKYHYAVQLLFYMVFIFIKIDSDEKKGLKKYYQHGLKGTKYRHKIFNEIPTYYSVVRNMKFLMK